MGLATTMFKPYARFVSVTMAYAHYLPKCCFVELPAWKASGRHLPPNKIRRFHQSPAHLLFVCRPFAGKYFRIRAKNCCREYKTMEPTVCTSSLLRGTILKEPSTKLTFPEHVGRLNSIGDQLHLASQTFRILDNRTEPQQAKPHCILKMAALFVLEPAVSGSGWRASWSKPHSRHQTPLRFRGKNQSRGFLWDGWNGKEVLRKTNKWKKKQRKKTQKQNKTKINCRNPGMFRTPASSPDWTRDLQIFSLTLSQLSYFGCWLLAGLQNDRAVMPARRLAMWR